MHIFSHLWLNPAGRTDVVGGPHRLPGTDLFHQCVSPLSTIPTIFSKVYHYYQLNIVIMKINNPQIKVMKGINYSISLHY